jgi:hypothetical protein
MPEPAASADSPVVTGPIVMSAPPDAIQLPRQRPGGDRRRTPDYSPLRRRVPGHQLPADTGTRLSSPALTPDDADAARAAVEAFEDGVSRAHWEVIEADITSPSTTGQETLTRRVPGATLPLTEPANPEPPASPSAPLDPDEARALVEQFEYGVALALRETQPQHEGQPR